ncbi:MAG: hypothetical protein GVY10_11110 [Verrucomicrobia bacterium]|jgi:acyl-CoA reductase-like NAD-dependent aldehyde dehydrogenase|nr:hypothetical protein [Verrucomicrobiota bacterium]
MNTISSFIGGEWMTSTASEFTPVHNPSTGEVIGRTPHSPAAEVGALEAGEGETLYREAW